MCFSLWWFFQVLIWLVVVVAAIKIFEIVVGWLGLPIGGPVAQIFRILLWAVCAIILIVLAYDVLSCLLGSGVSLMPRGR